MREMARTVGTARVTSGGTVLPAIALPMPSLVGCRVVVVLVVVVVVLAMATSDEEGRQGHGLISESGPLCAT